MLYSFPLLTKRVEYLLIVIRAMVIKKYSYFIVKQSAQQSISQNNA